jgi:hypothetical protein
MEARKCGTCNLTIGGQNHVFANTEQTKVNDIPPAERGYHFKQVQDVLTQRDLTPNEYYLLVLIVHCCLLVGLYKFPTKFAEVCNTNLENSIETCWLRINECWETLLNRLGLADNKELMCALIHKLIHDLSMVDSFAQHPVSEEIRSHHEKEFSRLCVPLISDPVNVGNEAINHMLSDMDIVPYFEKRLLERDKPDNFVSKCLRVIKRPSFEDFLNKFLNSRELMTKYPIIKAYLENEEDLDRFVNIMIGLSIVL